MQILEIFKRRKFITNLLSRLFFLQIRNHKKDSVIMVCYKILKSHHNKNVFIVWVLLIIKSKTIGYSNIAQQGWVLSGWRLRAAFISISIVCQVLSILHLNCARLK